MLRNRLTLTNADRAGAAILAVLLLSLSAFGVLAWAQAMWVAVFLALGWLGARLSLPPLSEFRRVQTASQSGLKPSPLLDSDAVAQVLEPCPDPVIVLDGTARIVMVNRAARQLKRSAVKGRHISSAVRTPGLLEAIDRVRNGAPPQTVEYSILVPFERHLRAFVAAVDWQETAARTNPVVVVIHDLTAAKRLEQMRVDFVASASHELRTPLASLVGFIETLRGPAREDRAAQDKFLQIMADQAARMGGLVNDLLSLSRIELNEHVPPADEVDLRHLIQDVSAAAMPLATEGGVDIHIEGESDGPVLGDREELFQVFQNLLDNALNYAPDGKRIDILIGSGIAADPSAPVQDISWVSVRDYGPGIAREHIPRLTERFYRTDVGQSRRSGGTGLGLAIVKHIVNRHRGWLEIRSTIGEGSSFTVTLPRAIRENALSEEIVTVELPDPSGGIGEGAVSAAAEPTRDQTASSQPSVPSTKP